MSVFPSVGLDPLVSISSFSLESVFRSAEGGSSSSYPSSNTAYFIPFSISKTIVVKKMFSYNGATASNNLDIGIYDSFGTRIISSGSTAQSGTNTLQEFDITDTRLSPGTYYMAIASDSILNTLFSINLGDSTRIRHTGVARADSSFPLPATVTLAAMNQNFIPVIGLSTRSVI